jgi:rhodanese-related sulfurtransferase
MGKYFITAEQLWSSFGGTNAPIVADVRRRKVYDSEDSVVPGAIWFDHMKTDDLAALDTHGRDLVIYCVHGHQVSQSATAALRATGKDVRVLRGGIEAWKSAGLPTRRRESLPDISGGSPSRWVTRRRPKIDRIACPWFIKRFIDPTAEILYTDADQVLNTAEEIGAIAFDVEGGEITHDGDRCSFDVLLDRSGIDDPALTQLATIIRGADTAKLDLAPEAAGLLAMSIGISAIAGEDDRLSLSMGMTLYDALYAWRRKSPKETHNWPAGKSS